jgi:cytochrome c-type biogenesis protein CcmH/NrfG
MADERTLDRLIAHLRTHVAELRRLEQEGADPIELVERKRLILRLQEHLAQAVRDVVSVPRPSHT